MDREGPASHARTEGATPAESALPPLWRLLESWFARRYGIETLENDPEALLAYNLCTHGGAPVRLQCGTVLRPGDRLMEVHFRREALLPLMQDGDPARMALGLMKLAERDMPRLARAVARDPRLRDVRALHALTLFHRGITRYGFEVMPVEPRWVEWWFTRWHRLLMARDHAGHGRHVRAHREKLVTRHVWQSRGALLRRYGVAEEPCEDQPGPVA